MNRDDKYYWEFKKELGKVVENDQVDDFLEGILTPGELEQLAKRLQIVKKLKKGKPQRDIAEELEVGLATVTRGARELNNGRFEYIN